MTLLQPALPVRRDRRVAGRRDDPLVGGEQVVGVGVEVGDPADHGRAGDEVVAVGQQVRHQPDIARIALDELIVRMIIVGLGHLAVLGEVVHPDHLVPAPEQLLHQVPADEACGPADGDLLH